MSPPSSGSTMMVPIEATMSPAISAPDRRS
jgi:hypothetical protein